MSHALIHFQTRKFLSPLAVLSSLPPLSSFPPPPSFPTSSPILAPVSSPCYTLPSSASPSALSSRPLSPSSPCLTPSPYSTCYSFVPVVVVVVVVVVFVFCLFVFAREVLPIIFSSCSSDDQMGGG